METIDAAYCVPDCEVSPYLFNDETYERCKGRLISLQNALRLLYPKYALLAIMALASIKFPELSILTTEAPVGPTKSKLKTVPSSAAKTTPTMMPLLTNAKPATPLAELASLQERISASHVPLACIWEILRLESEKEPVGTKLRQMEQLPPFTSQIVTIL